ncbi:hypothetical protein [Frankia sp. Cr1]|uniref:hypothetical protein n=1 Tax=Frankia sp. Cr1 TaxID=3073931 RepID=UPI002AD3E21F|nr:hypothetical protein [Frankia sp. Cr1]
MPAALGQPVGGMPVAGVGAGPKQRDGSVEVAAPGQQVGQPVGGLPVAGVGAGPKLINVAALGQQVGQPAGGMPLGADPGEVRRRIRD